MAAYLLIGPSGSGKSMASKIISERGASFSVVDLDKELKKRINGESLSNHLAAIGDKAFFEFSRDVIEEISAGESRKVLIVVGAGSINYNEGHSWYLQQNLISLIGSPIKLYERGDRKIHHPEFESYLNTEFNASRKKLYDGSNFRIDVTERTPDEVADCIIEAVTA